MRHPEGAWRAARGEIVPLTIALRVQAAHSTEDGCMVRTRFESLGVMAVVLILAAAAPVRAEAPATLQATVTDTQNAIMPGVTIVVRNPATGIERTVTTDAAGQYGAAPPPPRRYTG